MSGILMWLIYLRLETSLRKNEMVSTLYPCVQWAWGSIFVISINSSRKFVFRYSTVLLRHQISSNRCALDTNIHPIFNTRSHFVYIFSLSRRKKNVISIVLLLFLFFFLSFLFEFATNPLSWWLLSPCGSTVISFAESYCEIRFHKYLLRTMTILSFYVGRHLLQFSCAMPSQDNIALINCNPFNSRLTVA